MPENHNNPIFIEYENRKNNNNISSNLRSPSPASLRDECLIVYKEKGNPKDDITLRSFFGALNKDEDYANRIANYDIDKFRPLSYCLRKTSQSTNRINVDLLKWLMGDEGEKPSPPPPPDPPHADMPWYKMIINSLNKNAKVALVSILILLIGKLVFNIWMENELSIRQPNENEKCMYLAGYHFEPISCDEIKPKVLIIPLDENKLKRLRKIPFYLKVTKHDVGRLWRANINGRPEYFTDSGMHPVDIEKRLVPLSNYMVTKYETEKNLITDIINWTYYILLIILALITLLNLQINKNKI